MAMGIAQAQLKIATRVLVALRDQQLFLEHQKMGDVFVGDKIFQ
jgi:hypothetical protein